MAIGLEEGLTGPLHDEIAPHSRLTALVLCWPFGFFGLHRFYVGKVGTGVLQLLTLGGLQVWALVDFVLILGGGFTDRNGRRVKQWTTDDDELQLLPILIVAAATSALQGGWIAVLARSANPSLAEFMWPLIGVQAVGGLAIGSAVPSHPFLHAMAASVVGSYMVYVVVTVVGLVILAGAQDAGQGAGLVAFFMAAICYLVTPVAGLLSLVGGAVRSYIDPTAAA